MNYQCGEKITFTVNRAMGDLAPRKLAHYVASRLEISGRRAERLCALKAVKFNDEIIGANAARPLAAGDVFTIVIPENWLPHLIATPMQLEIIYEDEFLIAVNKPSGIIVHSARGHLFGNSLQNGVLYHCRDDARADKVIAPPHRLDKDTSGVSLFSRTGRAYRELCARFKSREVEKIYLAIVEGEPDWDEILVDAPIGADPQNPKIGAIVAVENCGKAAQTSFRVIRRNGKTSLIAARPRTGRTHQIRLHLRHLGLPLIGDKDYNPQSQIVFPRQALHAQTLIFRHPLTNENLRLVAPLPPDMAEFFQAV